MHCFQRREAPGLPALLGTIPGVPRIPGCPGVPGLPGVPGIPEGCLMIWVSLGLLELLELLPDPVGLEENNAAE